MSPTLDDLSDFAAFVAADIERRGLSERVLWSGAPEHVWAALEEMRPLHPDAERFGIAWQPDGSADVIGWFTGMES